MSKPICITVTPTNRLHYDLTQIPHFPLEPHQQNLFQNTGTQVRRGSQSKSPFLWNKRISSVSRQNGTSANKIGIKTDQAQSRKIREGKEQKKSLNPEQENHMQEHKKQERHKERRTGEATELEILRSELERERRQKGYWKSFALKLEELNKIIKFSEKSQKSEGISAHQMPKIHQGEVQKLMNQKIEVQKQIMKLQSENRELTRRLHQFEKNEKLLKKQISNSLQKDISGKSPHKNVNFHLARPQLNTASHQHFSRSHQERKQLQFLRRVVLNQDEIIFHLNQEITLTKMKLLELKYLNASEQ